MSLTKQWAVAARRLESAQATHKSLQENENESSWHIPFMPATIETDRGVFEIFNNPDYIRGPNDRDGDNGDDMEKGDD